ncbi:phage/plasmid primase, P4 family [Mycolicibacterium llatzerense]
MTTVNDTQRQPSVNDLAATRDLRMAGRLETKSAGLHRFITKRGWHWYDGTVWQLDHNESRIQQLLVELLEELWPSAFGDQQLKDDIQRCHTSGGISGVLKIASKLPGFSARIEDFDAKPWLLNTPGGTIDLRENKVRAHNPDDLLTHITRGRYRKNAYRTSEHFRQMIERIQPDENTLEYLGRVAGSALLGEHREDRFVIWLGELGNNGKTVLDGAIRYALGDYASIAPRELVMETKFSHSSDNMVLFRKRYVSIDETNRGERIDEAKMKSLSGGGTLTGRDLYEKRVSWEPTHSLTLMTNHGPKVSGDDKASWRRIVVIPFNVRLPDPDPNDPNSADVGLSSRLAGDADAVIDFLLRGYVRYQKQGLADVPEAVRHATTAYYEANDELLQFRRDCCEEAAHLTESNPALLAEYRAWCEREGIERPYGARAFGKYMDGSGFKREAGGDKLRQGIALKGRLGQVRRAGAAPESASD